MSAMAVDEGIGLIILEVSTGRRGEDEGFSVVEEVI